MSCYFLRYKQSCKNQVRKKDYSCWNVEDELRSVTEERSCSVVWCYSSRSFCLADLDRFKRHQFTFLTILGATYEVFKKITPHLL